MHHRIQTRTVAGEASALHIPLWLQLGSLLHIRIIALTTAKEIYRRYPFLPELLHCFRGKLM